MFAKMEFDFGFHLHFIFFPDATEYNCSGTSSEVWDSKRAPSLSAGLWFIGLGIFSCTIYSILLIAMSTKENLNNSCLKLIYFNCWIDCGSIACGGLITGWLFIKGHNYCTSPFWTLAPGAVGLGCWSSSCVLCIALALSRVCALNHFEWGKLNYIVMVIASIYGIFMMVGTRPIIFNAQRGSWFFSPYIANETFYNSYHLTENLLVTIITPILYVYVSVKLCCHPVHRVATSPAHRKLQMLVSALLNYNKGLQACLQSFLISVLICIAAVLFAYMQVFECPSWLPFTAEVAYQICGTLPAAVLLIVNKNIRRRAIWVIFRKDGNDSYISKRQNASQATKTAISSC